MKHIKTENDWTFYCDDSGHTGRNNLDLDQPFHVAGGLLVPTGSASMLEETMQLLLDNAPQKVKEYKGNKLMTSTKGCARILDTLVKLTGNGCYLFYVVFEKRFMVASKITDTFFDPVYNPHANWLPLTNIEEREKISYDFFHYLSDSTLNIFHEWLRSPKSSDEVLSLIIKEINEPKVRNTLSQCIGTIDFQDFELSEELFGLKGRLISSSMTIPTFRHLIFLVDKFMDRFDPNYCVIHDNTSYENAFKFLLEKCAKGKSSGFTSPFGYHHRMSLKNYSGFETNDSKLNLGLQAADFVASSVNSIFKGVKSDIKFNKNKNLLFSLMSKELIGAYRNIPIFHQLSASVEFQVQLLNRLN